MIGFWSHEWGRRDSERYVTLSAFRPMTDGWTVGLSISYEGHPSEALLEVHLVVFTIGLWWRRHPTR